MLKKISLLVGIVWMAAGLHAQTGNWTFVGPYSNNNANGHEFESSHMNNIIIDPNDSTHLFAASKFAGLWESTDKGGYWTNISTTPTGLNGVLGIAFRSSSELLVGNYHPLHDAEYSNSVSIYKFSTNTWISLAPLPAASTYVIKSVAVHPDNSLIFFACTSIGLFRSDDGGLSWTQPVSGCIENMVFMPKYGSGHYCYIAGSDLPGDGAYPLGEAMLQESSDDGVTFTDISSNIVIDHSRYVRSHTKVCLGAVNDTTGESELLTLTVATGAVTSDPPYGWDSNPYAGSPGNPLAIPPVPPTPPLYAGHYVHELTKNIITAGSVSLVNTLVDGYQAHPSSDRMAIKFDEYNALVWVGTQMLNCYNFGNGYYYPSINTSIKMLGCAVHMDLHEFAIGSSDAQSELYVACDGGLARASLNIDTIEVVIWNPDTLIGPIDGPIRNRRIGTGTPNPESVCFSRINNNLNVCLINGFSGSQDHPNLYALGAQDITNNDIYDADSMRNRYTHSGGENDGALIYKFDDNLMLLDLDSYSSTYRVSQNGGASYTQSVFYEPSLTSPTFAADLDSVYETRTDFGAQRFKQDPYRPGRLFSLGHMLNPQFMQMDFNAKKFVVKMAFGGSVYPLVGWEQMVTDLSFSPQTINSMHVVTSSRYFPSISQSISSRLYKYIGPDIDNCWYGHNDAYYWDVATSSWKDQWADITPDFVNLSTVIPGANNVATADLGKATLVAVETSPWNKDLIYVACNINTSATNRGLKILTYNGSTWADYSNGIPADEVACSMIMDHASNDEIYLSTDKAIYFRRPSMPTWILYNTGFPIINSRQMEINYAENTVRAGTYGMGIFKSDLKCPAQNNWALTGSIPQDIYEAETITANGPVASALVVPTAFRGTSSVTLNPGFSASGSVNPNQYFIAFIHGCVGGTHTSPGMYRSHPMLPQPKEISQEEEEEMQEEDVTIYPNPSTGVFKIETEEDEKAMIYVYNMKGEKVKSFVHRGTISSMDLGGMPKGIYMVKIITEDKSISKKIILE
ncbi:MAG: repeat-containing protein [Bacteroidetes bacterium]|nr:repeat-containing protein [Bacteroidota bacterium]